jgi:cytochrome c oxidase subunit 2
MNLRLLLPLAALLLSGCETSTMDTLIPNSDLTRETMGVYERIFWWTTLLFVGVQGALIYIAFRFRATGNEKGNPEQVHGNTQLELTWTIAPVFILLHISIPTVAYIFKHQAQPSADALEINAVGKQWWFAFEYPDDGVVTANEIHVPLGRQVVVRLQSDNVMHSFFVPQLTAKRDMLPGHVNSILFTPEKVGRYAGQCAEYCGDSHALMKFQVVVDTPEDFARWLDAQRAPADTTSADAVAGFNAFSSAGCVACHAIGGTTAAANIGPNLTHVGSRARIASGILDNNQANLVNWIRRPDVVKPGSKMPNLNVSEETANSIATYLLSLK